MTKRVIMRFSAAGALALATGACASGGGAPAGAEAERLYADLSGSWELVAEESGTLSEAMRNAESKLAPEIQLKDPRSRRGGTRGALDPRGAPEAKAQQPDRMVAPAALEGVMRMCTRLAVAVDAAQLFLDPDGFDSTTLQIGADARRETMGTLRVESKAQWKGRELVVERRIDDGPVVTQALRVAQDGRLHVAWTIDTGARLMQFVQVYAPASD